MQLTAKLVKVLPIQSGTGQNGEWKKQDIIVETDGQYARKVCISIWGDKINENQFRIGNILIIDFVPDSKEFKDKWYTTLIATNIEVSNFNSPFELAVPFKNQNESRIDESITFKNISFQGKIGKASKMNVENPEKLYLANKYTEPKRKIVKIPGVLPSQLLRNSKNNLELTENQEDALSSPTSEQAIDIFLKLKEIVDANKHNAAKEAQSGNLKNSPTEQEVGVLAKLREKVNALKLETEKGAAPGNPNISSEHRSDNEPDIRSTISPDERPLLKESVTIPEQKHIDREKEIMNELNIDDDEFL
jgi:hypothetical protein